MQSAQRIAERRMSSHPQVERLLSSNQDEWSSRQIQRSVAWLLVSKRRNAESLPSRRASHRVSASIATKFVIDSDVRPFAFPFFLFLCARSSPNRQARVVEQDRTPARIAAQQKYRARRNQ